MQLNKIESIYSALDMGDAKAAMKIFAKEVDKNAKKITADLSQ